MVVSKQPSFSCSVLLIRRELRKEQLRARLALLPLLQAEHDRRYVHLSLRTCVVGIN